jgi:Uma2 family endonuclease
MLEEEVLLPLLTEDDLPDSDNKPVDNELQVLAPALLRAILAYIWADRQDWFFGINLGVYYDPKQPAIGPDGFLSLGVARVRSNGQLRLSYVVRQEKVVPQWVLEIVSKEPGGEYDEKWARYAAIGVLYYTIYNPAHADRDGHGVFEVYKLLNGEYVQQRGNPVWMPELGLGIGHEVRRQDGMNRDWLYWYDESGGRHLAPEDALAQERILRGREQLMRRQLEEELAEERIGRAQEVQARIQAQQQLEQAQLQSESRLEQASRAMILRQLTRRFGAVADGLSPAGSKQRPVVDHRAVNCINELNLGQLESLGEALLDFGSLDDLTTWLDCQE